MYGEIDKRPVYYELITNLNQSSLNALHDNFKATPINSYTGKDDCINGLNRKEFVIAINKMFDDQCNYEAISIDLFNDINKQKNGTIVWDNFLDFIINGMKINYLQPLEFGEPKYIAPTHVKKETISNIVLIETEKYFCYAFVSKHGRVGLYDGYLNFLTTYSLIMSKEDVYKPDEQRRQRNRWVTDAYFLVDVEMFVVANSTRSLTIYDASGLKHMPIFLILGFQYIIKAIAYRFPKNESKSSLCFGLDNGQLLLFNFQKPKDGLLRRKHNDKLSFYYYQELSSEQEFLIIKNIGRIHKETINMVEYYNNTNTTISCSTDTSKSVIIRPVDNKQEPYIFKMRRGANCFAISHLLKILITGSDDGVIRIWNSVITSTPLSVLTAHRYGIVDVVIMEDLKIFLSCSRDAVFKLWDLKEQRCLQTINLKFSPFKIKGKIIEWGIRSIYQGPKQKMFEDSIKVTDDVHSASIIEKQSIIENKWERQFIMVSCCNYVAKIKLLYKDGRSRHFQTELFPPPPLQNSVLIPKNWKVLEDQKPIDNNIANEKGIDEANETSPEEIKIYMDKLKFILNKPVLGENGLNNEINYKIATLESKKLRMQSSIEKFAPYLALDLYEIEDIKLNADLPVTSNRKIRNLVEKTTKMLEDATARSVIFSDTSTYSKSPRSTRSSVIEFD